MRDETDNKPETVCSAMAELFHYKWNSFNAARSQTEPNWTYTYSVFAKKVNVTGNEFGCCSSASVEVIFHGAEIIEYAPQFVSYYSRTYNLKGILDNYDICPVGGTCTNRQWYWSNSPTSTLYTISGATNATLTYTTTSEKYITYKVDVTQGGVTYTDVTAIYKIYGGSVFYPHRIEEDTLKELNPSFISVFPNPTDGSFYIKISGNQTKEGVLTLLDLSGKEYLKGNLILAPKTPVQVQLTEFVPDGIYILAFRNNERNNYFKIIVSKQ